MYSVQDSRSSVSKFQLKGGTGARQLLLARTTRNSHAYVMVVCGCQLSAQILPILMSLKEPILSPRATELKARANDFFKSGDFDKAFDMFTAAISEENQSPALYSNRSATAIKMKNFDQALRDAEKAVKVSGSPHYQTSADAFIGCSLMPTGIKPMAGLLQHTSALVNNRITSLLSTDNAEFKCRPISGSSYLLFESCRHLEGRAPKG
jgi:tetratricopeptide (TPR) repeat protein